MPRVLEIFPPVNFYYRRSAGLPVGDRLCYCEYMEKNKWNSEKSTATQMKQVISSKKSQKTPSSPKTSDNQRYWDEGRVLKVGFLLVFVRYFAKLILKGFSKFSPVFLFLFMIVLGGGTLSLMENFKGPEGSEVVREGRQGDSGGVSEVPGGVSVGGIELYDP